MDDLSEFLVIIDLFFEPDESFQNVLENVIGIVVTVPFIGLSKTSGNGNSFQDVAMVFQDFLLGLSFLELACS